MAEDGWGRPLVRIRNLRFRYPNSDRDVLRIPDLDISGTGLIAVTGLSGSGKSTLTELIAGTLHEPYEGSVQVLGVNRRPISATRSRFGVRQRCCVKVVSKRVAGSAENAF